MAKAPASKTETASNGLRALVFLVLALVAGAAATIMVYELIQSYKARIAAAQQPEETEMVIVAAGDLYPGVTIAESDIVGIQVPKKYVPADAFTAPELVVGRIPRERILGNEFIRPGRLADGEAGIGLNALVPPGMRAISLNIADAAAVSGFLEPGNRVDLLVTIKGEKANDMPTTITMLQTVPILAVNGRLLKDDQQQTPDPNDPNAPKKVRAPIHAAPSVTLAVTPEQAETVAYAMHLGRITLDLRGDVDLDNTTVAGVETPDLFPNQPPPPPPEPAKAKVPRKPTPPPPPPDQGLTIIKGSSSQTRTDLNGGH